MGGGEEEGLRDALCRPGGKLRNPARVIVAPTAFLSSKATQASRYSKRRQGQLGTSRGEGSRKLSTGPSLEHRLHILVTLPE